MGVKGLTSYIAKHADQYLVPYELHDTCLVIDGDSLASMLYSNSHQMNSAFGGDYHRFAELVERFFAALRKCNVRSFVLLDGGYQRRKLRTVHSRLRSKIACVRHLNPSGGNRLFPLQMRECFVEVAGRCPNVRLMRCLFEADDEVAQLARRLNCPVLSYDSDFYIHNVLYVPSVTLTAKPLLRQPPRRNRRKPAATAERIRSDFRPFWYLDCCVYTLANMVRGRLRPEVVPLFGVLLGNDYVAGSVFRRFFAQVSTRSVGKRHSPQQKRIVGLMRWLAGETLASARAKVLESVEIGARAQLAKDIDRAMEGYLSVGGEAFAYFGLDDTDVRLEQVEVIEVKDSDEDEADNCTEDEREEQSVEDEDDAEEVQDLENSVQTNFVHRQNAESLPIGDWLLSLIRRCEVPRYVVDLLSLRMYINSPQVENVALRESNFPARPILQLLYALVHWPVVPDKELIYLTRCTKNASTFVNVALPPVDLGALSFEPAAPERNSAILFGKLFEGEDDLPSAVQSVPEDDRLFVLSLAYAAKHSEFVTPAHIHALLLCRLALRVCRRKHGIAFADEAHFRRQFEALLSKPGAPDERREAVQLTANLLAHWQVAKTVRNRHTSFSATTVHGFAEWQAVVFHLGTLNAILGSPFRSVSVADTFSGTLAYNLQRTMAERPDLLYYVRTFVFKGCAQMAEEYDRMLGVLGPIVGKLQPGVTAAKKKAMRNRRKAEKKRAAKADTNEQNVNEKSEIAVAGDDYDGIGNRFANLLIT